ncbi:MAG TPA: helix-turn-helix domain-containing protein, partial [Acidimicrobiales bacterium]
MDEPADQERRIGRIAALDQPLRRDLYALLVARGAWVTRDEAAAALDVARSVAAFHLDKLAEAGVVEVSYERTSGRTGPGAGRPSKRYRRSGDEVSASVPDRHYDLAGSLLATAIAESTRTGDPVTQCLSATAHAAGRRAGEEALG